jgi:ABC-type uncharacterized transport system ATPase subunit
VNLGILIFLGFNFFVHGINEMEFYIHVKEIKRVMISNGGGKESGKDTTAVAGQNPAGSVSFCHQILLQTLLPMVLVLDGFESCHCFSGNFEGR